MIKADHSGDYPLSAEKSSAEKCIFVCLTLHIEWRFNKNSLLRSYLVLSWEGEKNYEMFPRFTLYTKHLGDEAKANYL